MTFLFPTLFLIWDEELRKKIVDFFMGVIKFKNKKAAKPREF